MASSITPVRAWSALRILRDVANTRCLRRPFMASLSTTTTRPSVELESMLSELGQLSSKSAANKPPPVQTIPSSKPPPMEMIENEQKEEETQEIRLPRSVQALYLQPLKRKAEHGVPSCDLQLRSYSARSLEFFADFALRAAYYLKLPAAGPVPLPRITERWTVPRSNFAHKKSQENFERITMRRLIQIKDGHPDVVEIWLAFLKKHQYFGVGMKANVWDYEALDVNRKMDEDVEAVKAGVDAKWARFGRLKRKGGAAGDKDQESVQSQSR
ncbi:MAG: mitochondrial 37S ribosomal protein rsm10 [Watsoniomyces obsoletus]|nr:MAG: mitochondrial 37S ribosomal protein rsm10 [Watsoniomyces obsoletus]